MIYLFIGLAMLFILGPILMLRPTPRERRQARIRQYALSHKVAVSPISLKRNEKFNRLLQRNPHIENHHWCAYKLVAEEDQTGPSVKGEWLQRKTKEGTLVWEPVDVMQNTPPLVAQLLQQWQDSQTEDFLQLELGPRQVVVVWNERGDIDQVTVLCEQLKRLMPI